MALCIETDDLRLGFMIHPESELLETARLCKSMARGFKKSPYWGVDPSVEFKQEGIRMFIGGEVAFDTVRREFISDKIDGSLCLGVDRKSIGFSVADSWRLGLGVRLNDKNK
jgi:hypothetical protein